MIWVPKKNLLAPRGFSRAEPPRRGRCDSMLVNSYSFGGGLVSFADGADFDGTDFMLKNTKFTGQVDTKTGILSAWIFPDGNGGCLWDFRNGGSGIISLQVLIINNSPNWNIRIIGKSAANATVLQLDQTTGRAFGSGWYHVLASWDLATAGARRLYIDSTDETTQTTFTNTAVGYGTNGDGITHGDNGANNSKIDSGLAESYLALGQFLDFSNSTNRDKFSSGGHPISLGATGSTPTGTAPTFYGHLDVGQAASNFATNRSGNGNMTISGTLTTRATKP